MSEAPEQLEQLQQFMDMLVKNPSLGEQVMAKADAISGTDDRVAQAQADTRRIVAEELADLKAAVFAIGDGLQHLANHLGLGSRSDV